MSMLILCDTAYLKKGNFYGIILIVCIVMLWIYVKDIILLVVLKTLKNTFPSNVSLRIMEFYLLMPRVFITIMVLNKLKNLLLSRVLMKLLL